MDGFTPTESDLQAQAPRVPAPEPYVQWKRPKVYVSFGLGMAAASMLFVCIGPQAIIMGWFALGCGIPAILVGKSEVREFPEAEGSPLIKWGKRTGLLGIVIGPATAIVWTIIMVASGGF